MQSEEREHVIGRHAASARPRSARRARQSSIIGCRATALPLSSASCPRATSSRMRATVAGAARNSARRCTSVSERALSHNATRPVERRVAAAADDEILLEKIAGRLDPVVHVAAFELLDAGHAQAPRLKRPHAAGNDHGAGNEPRAGGGRDVKLAALEHAQLGDFLTEMKRGMERLRLLQQAIDQFLGPANGQRRECRRSACRDKARCIGRRANPANR